VIRSIRINRFKSIDEIELPLGAINILIGSNNSGKSSIQQAIQFSVSIAQTAKQQNSRWVRGRCPSSLSSESLIYSPLRDIEALAPGGNLQTPIEHAIKVTFVGDEVTSVTIKKGKNRNITTSIEGRVLGESLQDIESPFSIIVPGLAGIPASEEFRPPSVVRKAAAKGDSNSVFRNVLLLLSEDSFAWRSFKDKFNTVFPDHDVNVSFNPNVDEYIDARVVFDGASLPIDSCGTGILQAIQILAYYYLYRPNLLILDEPDSHLHPNNQRILAKLLEDLSSETGCQLMVSTHSRHFFEALKDSATVHWINNSSLVENSEDVERNILLEIGALDKGDQLRGGEVPCVLLTEDTDTSYIEVLAEASGFVPGEFQVWSYHGCSNVHIAKALNSFISDHAPGTAVVVHRDRDYMNESEVSEYRQQLENVGMRVFITDRNDAESHFLNEGHISELYPDLSEARVSEFIDNCLVDRRDAILEKYINTIYERKLRESYNGGAKPNAGRISTDCTRNFDEDPRGFMHGKVVEKALRNRLQQELGGVPDLCRVTGWVSDSDLSY